MDQDLMTMLLEGLPKTVSGEVPTLYSLRGWAACSQETLQRGLAEQGMPLRRLPNDKEIQGH